MSTPAAQAGPAPRRATRDLREPIIGGVAAGLARHLALPVLWVRVAFVVTAALGGMGIAFYAGLWLLLPAGARSWRSRPSASAWSSRWRRCSAGAR
jgi:phage shock protein PspC (stress-responsive transcriptional regulator)